MLHRLAFVLLLCVLPLQFVWAAATPYCAHETDPALAAHFGHHEHQHQASAKASTVADPSGVSSSFDHVDCESCHLGAGASLAMSVMAAFDVPPRDVLRDDHPPRYQSHTPAGLERPDIATHTPAARSGGGVVSGLPALD
jgi:hypothetical protein